MASRTPSVPAVHAGSRLSDLPSRLRRLQIAGSPESKRIPLLKDKFLPRFKPGLSNTQKKYSKPVPPHSDGGELEDESISASNTLYSRLDETELELSHSRYPSVSKLFSKLKWHSTLDDLPITNNLPFKAFSSPASSFDHLNSDSDATPHQSTSTFHSRLPIHARNNAVRNSLPSSIQSLGATSEALDHSRSAPNKPPWPPKLVSDLPSFSDRPTTRGYQTDPGVSNLGSHNVRPPESIVDEVLGNLPNDSCQRSVTTTGPEGEPEGQHRLSLRQFLLAAARQLATKHSPGNPETGRPNSSKDSRCPSGRNAAKDTAARLPESKSTAHRGKKRRNDDQGSGNGGGGSPKRSKPDTNPFVRLACPFFKDDPIKYSRCAMLGFDTASHMLQHLYRSHYEKRCPRCGTGFKKEQVQAWNTHVRSCNEERRQAQDNTYEGLTEDQVTRLRGRQRIRQTSEVERWYNVWQIIFGTNVPRPQSPLVGDNISRLAMAHISPLVSADTSLARELTDEGLITSPSSLRLILERLATFLGNTLTIQSHESEPDNTAPSDNGEAGSPPSTPSIQLQIDLETITPRMEIPGRLRNVEINTTPPRESPQDNLFDSGGHLQPDQDIFQTPSVPNLQEPDDAGVNFDGIDMDAWIQFDQSESSDKGKGQFQ